MKPPSASQPPRPRTPEEVARRVLANRPLMEQLDEALAEEARGERGIPLREILRERREHRSA